MATSSDELPKNMTRTVEIQNPYAVESVTCNENTLYPETCRFMDCKQKLYHPNATIGCEACQHEAESVDIGI